MVKIIVAISKNRVIGGDNKLLWNYPEDLKRFKKLTTGSVIIMGRKTFESIGRLLPNRKNVIITRKLDYSIEGAEVYNSLEEAIDMYPNCFIIGGGEIYKQSIQYADKIYLTLIKEEYEGDTYFPELGDEWKKIKNEKLDKISFQEYEKYKF